jgi:hydrogenase large subunit
MSTILKPENITTIEGALGTQIINLDPATRLEGHLKVQTEVTNGKVTTARSSGMMFRGFENLLVGKDPRDAAVITQRVCGVCPISHAMASCLAMEAMNGAKIPDNARIVRNLILGANFLQSHILHFYHLALLSYVKGPAMPPWTPAYDVDLRFTAAQNQTLVDHYIQALTFRRQAHEMAAIFAGKMPHTSAYEYGGVTTVVKKAQVTKFSGYLDGIAAFIQNVYLPDVDLLSKTYPDYYQIGKGYGNLLAYGVFDSNAAGTSKLLRRGRVENASASVKTVDTNAILEQNKYSWYLDSAAGVNPAKGVTQPTPDKAAGYSWLKAPRYSALAYEVGPLARMWVNGDYRNGISVMDRHQARAQEAQKIAAAMKTWLSQLNLASSFYANIVLPQKGSGIGLTEAPRGALGHWITVSNGLVSSYQIVTPTCWNCSPRDNSGKVGPLEKALEGVAVSNAAKPIEILRVVQSYDPCLSCAVH